MNFYIKNSEIFTDWRRVGEKKKILGRISSFYFAIKFNKKGVISSEVEKSTSKAKISPFRFATVEMTSKIQPSIFLYVLASEPQ